MTGIDTASRARLSAFGLRSTAAAGQLLALSEQAGDVLLTHAQIHHRLRMRQVEINKVSLYRLLDRFVAAGILQRVVDQGRVSRYGRCQGSVRASGSRFTLRFECFRCRSVYQLSDLPPGMGDALRQALVGWSRRGHEAREADVTVRGVCARCIPH